MKALVREAMEAGAIGLSTSLIYPPAVITEATSDGRTHLRAGDIWVKKDTGLRMATRADLEAMYQKRIDEEAETRARSRFKHIQEEFGPALIRQVDVPQRP